MIKAIERICECMKRGPDADSFEYDEELRKLVNEFGLDFVCQHACKETWYGGRECPPLDCERPDCHGTLDPEEDGEYTCRQACRDYIECGLCKPSPTTVLLTCRSSFAPGWVDAEVLARMASK